jgi:hypothetical protein
VPHCIRRSESQGPSTVTPTNRAQRPIKIRPVDIPYPGPVWQAIEEWNKVGTRMNTRLGENAMRIALITAACNGEMEVSDACLNAALAFGEWQEHLREVFRPGVAENKEAECQNEIIGALYEQLLKQKSTGEIPKGAEDVRDLNWTRVLNGGSFYRSKGVTLINREEIDGRGGVYCRGQEGSVRPKW